MSRDLFDKGERQGIIYICLKRSQIKPSTNHSGFMSLASQWTSIAKKEPLFKAPAFFPSTLSLTPCLSLFLSNWG